MPFYEFKCIDCGHKQEHLLKMDALVEKCPKCNGLNYQKQVSSAVFSLKGSGFYKNDYKSCDVKKNTSDQNGCGGNCSCH